MDIKGIRYFIAAAEHLNFTRAAEACCITQTAMSTHIAKMEEELGVVLFKRSNRKVELTPAGRAFYGKACQTVRTYEEAVQAAVDIDAGNTGRLTLLFPSYIEGQLFMPAIRQFRLRHPSLKLKIRIGEPRLFYQQMLQEKETAAFCWPYDFRELPELNAVEVAAFPTCVYMHASHPLMDLPAVTPQHLARETCVILEPRRVPNSYRYMRNSWVEAGFEPQKVIKVSTLEEILLTLEEEQAVALLPSYVQNYLTAQIFAVPLRCGKKLGMPLWGFYLKEEENSLAAGFLQEAKFYLTDSMEEKLA